MFFDHDGKHYRLMFRYGVDKYKHRTVTASVEERATVTTVDGVQEKWIPVIIGKSRTNPLDRFLKEDGRVLSLRRASDNMGRDMRKAAWDAYTNRRSYHNRYKLVKS